MKRRETCAIAAAVIVLALAAASTAHASGARIDPNGAPSFWDMVVAFFTGNGDQGSAIDPNGRV